MRKLIFTLALAAMTAMIPAEIIAKKQAPKRTAPKKEAVAKRTEAQVRDSLKTIKVAADAGDAKSQNEVGMWYYVGRHVDKDYKQAAQWWARAAEQNYTQAIGNLGLCYQTGNGVKKDTERAAKLYTRSVKDGNKALFAQLEKLATEKPANVFENALVAKFYREGIGTKKDINKALPFMKNLANAGDVQAQFDLGRIFLQDKQDAKAAQWFKKAADNGNINAAFIYGQLLMEGKGVPMDKKEGFNYALRAAEKDQPVAMYYVGNCYMKGEGVVCNAAQAVKWYKESAAKGNPNAQFELANAYRLGNGIERSYDQALNWYAAAATRGKLNAFKKMIPDSLANTPFMNYMKGVKYYQNNDFKAALNEFKAVEKAKITDGKVMQAVVLLNKDYEKQNFKKGVKLLSKAIEEGDAQALFYLGGCYEVGKGVAKDMDLAVRYVKQAAEMGYGPAECYLGDMYYEGRGVPQSYKDAAEWYAAADEQGLLNPAAAKRYAACYQQGLGGLTANKDKAAEILKHASRNTIGNLLKLI